MRSQRVALVDQRPDLLAFLKEKLVAHGYQVITVMTEEDADALRPKPDLVLVDFERTVDLAQVLQVIEVELGALGPVKQGR